MDRFSEAMMSEVGVAVGSEAAGRLVTLLDAVSDEKLNRQWTEKLSRKLS